MSVADLLAIEDLFGNVQTQDCFFSYEVHVFSTV